ncbi:Chemotaxis regulator - transmits chemoreceptor signals to flagelllar motor components CheY [Paramagnetospirillum magnetotacticum MS-1]|uniref:histidine kinase n=1 Tax=Paramagnetospirillum magnetotacticum MS-1 TaxID=272627 RepID=A0A0C2YTN4_PARME|nr:ATP-binding protein [Paramagnetospirillum magnetotacticum]KIL98513.1 Chemotaxis regulator - transmits chemoreceptor signals to flagelllar motor components CheY [Paramagnetospirillum magnetotacticum MS-1]
MPLLVHFGIRAKLILIFVLIKVIPLLVLAGFAWRGQAWLAERVSENVTGMTRAMRETTELVVSSTTNSAIKALDDAARESLERLTTDTARNVATFLYDRDGDIRSAALIEPSEEAYRRFLQGRSRLIERHYPWVVTPDGTKWVPGPEAVPHYDAPPIQSSIEENRRNFNYRPVTEGGQKVERPLFLEMTFIGLDGREKVKVTTSDLVSPELRDVSRRENTFVKAETYFSALRDLGPDNIYVSDVIGAYVPSPIIGPFTPKAAAAKNIEFAPEKAAFAGTENPVGTRFRGLVRWVSPVVRGGKTVGWVSLALDHDHLMEFTDHILPTNDRYSPIADAASGNYAFIWDYKGRSVVHPRHYFITGYDPRTGEPAVPWLDTGLYAQWKESGKPIGEFLKTAPTFLDQSLKKKGAPELVKQGLLGLDCRYLNHAPQCTGWMDLTSQGGSGSFEISWSGLWKLTTAATIPYYTGPYGKSQRGFGFVTIGANVDDFHAAASREKEHTDQILALRNRDLEAQYNAVMALITSQVESLARELSISTVIMIALVVGIAVWMASFLTRRITAVVGGIHRFSEQETEYRLPVQGHDEMASLAISFNQMADRIGESFVRLDEARKRAEEASRMKSEFLANMSHELRTPLNGIIGFSELIRDEAADDETRENADIIEKSSRHLLELVNSILDIAKIEAGAMTLAVQDVKLAPLVAEAASVHHSAAQAKGITLSSQVSDNCPETIRADPLRLRQIIHNLLSNAVKFTEKGEVSLSVELEPGHLIFRVSDTGAGIPEGMLHAIFEKFRQVDSFLTRSHSGTGLGLTLARHLVELMGGTIGVQSTVGKGTVFHFTLPLHQPESSS